MKRRMYLPRLALLAMLLSCDISGSAQESPKQPRWLEDAKGCKFLDPDRRYPLEPISWSGECVNGFVEGKGDVVLELRKWTYSGTFRQGQLVEGKNARDNGTYEGRFKNNSLSGRGTLTGKNGRRIRGRTGWTQYFHSVPKRNPL